MTRKTLILAGSHLLALGVAFGVSRETARQGGKPGEDSGATRSASRIKGLPPGDGSQLLAEFMAGRAKGNSKYEQLKATLPVAADLKGALADAIAALGEPGWASGMSLEELREALAEVEVRVLHWLKVDPEAAMDFLVNGTPQLVLLSNDAFEDAAASKGVLASVSWLIKSARTAPIICALALDEMKAGAGLALFAKLESGMAGDPLWEGNRFPGSIENSSSAVKGFLHSVGVVTRFEEREALLKLAERQTNNEFKADLLAGFAQSSPQAAKWMLDTIGRLELDEAMARRLRNVSSASIQGDPSSDLEQRLQAMKTNERNASRPRQDLVNELVYRDVQKLMNEGRDWRYEFRNGTVTADEVLASVRGGLPGVTSEGEDEMLISVYRHLAEENPGKALSLLDGLTEEKRRETLFHSSWVSQVNVEPDDYLRFLEDIPEPQTPQEQELRTKGWNWKARGFLMRFGDDYVDWVQQMPAGLDKDTAMGSLIWATREQNPAMARELETRLYPPKE